MRVRQLGDPPSSTGPDAVRARGVGRLNGSELKLVAIAAGGSVQPHRHAHAHLVLILDGSGYVSVESVGPRRIGPDSVVMVEPGEEHAFGAGANEPLRFVCLDGREYPDHEPASQLHDH
jgi:quercetin dioxygenase-like cupin family protein